MVPNISQGRTDCSPSPENGFILIFSNADPGLEVSILTWLPFVSWRYILCCKERRCSYGKRLVSQAVLLRCRSHNVHLPDKH